MEAPFNKLNDTLPEIEIICRDGGDRICPICHKYHHSQFEECDECHEQYYNMQHKHPNQSKCKNTHKDCDCTCNCDCNCNCNCDCDCNFDCDCHDHHMDCGCHDHHKDCDCDCDCHDHHKGDICQPPDTIEIANCVQQLRAIAGEVLEFLKCRPTLGRLLPIYTCILLEQLRCIEELLTNRKFGLREIKREVSCIEELLCDPRFGLREIKREVYCIEELLCDPRFGLREIKNEIRLISNQIGQLNTNVNFGPLVNDIFNTVITINNVVSNEIVGLNEIKSEIILLEQIGLRSLANVTAGPLYTDFNAGFINAKVLNTTASPHSVTIKIARLDTCPPTLLFNGILPINAQCSNELTAIDLGQGANLTREFVVEIFNLTTGLYPTFIQTTIGGVPITGTAVKTAEFVPLIGNGINPVIL